MSFYSQFATYYELIFPYRQPVQDFLYSYAKQCQATQVLDIGCGTGHYTAAMAGQGLEAIGIDLDQAMIKVARQRFQCARFQDMNMLDIESLNMTFDFIFCIGNVLAHLNQDELSQMLKTVNNCLKPGGIWLFQVMNWEYILVRDDYTFPVKQIDAEKLEFQRHYSFDTTDNICFETQLSKEGQTIFKDSVMLYPFTSEDYLAFHGQAGFTLKEQVADYRWHPYNAGCDSANIFVFKK